MFLVILKRSYSTRFICEQPYLANWKQKKRDWVQFVVNKTVAVIALTSVGVGTK